MNSKFFPDFFHQSYNYFRIEKYGFDVLLDFFLLNVRIFHIVMILNVLNLIEDNQNSTNEKNLFVCLKNDHFVGTNKTTISHQKSSK